MFPHPEHSPRDPRRARNGGPRGPRGMGRGPAPARARLSIQVAEASAIHGAWLVAPMLLLALAAVLRLAMGGADSGFAICFALLLGLGVFWIGMRLCLPEPAAPACPHCKRKTLVRIDPQQSAGARCVHCSWRDERADARHLGVIVALAPQFRAGLQAARLPRALRPDGGAARTDLRDRPFGDRPPRGPSGRGRGRS